VGAGGPSGGALGSVGGGSRKERLLGTPVARTIRVGPIGAAWGGEVSQPLPPIAACAAAPAVLRLRQSANWIWSPRPAWLLALPKRTVTRDGLNDYGLV
jgi:hypothetical protein